MQILCLSITHHNTPVELRECLSLSAETIEAAMGEVPIREGRFETLREMTVLSTCNRLEVYALVVREEDPAVPAASLPLAYLQDVFAIPVQSIQPYLHAYTGITAVEHLFQVAAGLDSIALGETQILGQVARALDTALRCGSAHHVLSSLFRAAIHAGKRVRSETELGRRPISISSIAVQLAGATLGSLREKRVMIVGAGKMGGYALKALREYGAERILLANRTYQRAVSMVSKYGGETLPFERLAEGLEEADVVFLSTSAVLPVLQRDLVAEVMSRRPYCPLTLIDLAVPRNVDSRVKEIPGVQVFDMDGLQDYVASTHVDSHPNLASARAIVAEEVAEYESLLRIVPFLGELHKKVEVIRQREVERALQHLDNPDPAVREQLELMSQALVRKILHEPTIHLRTETNLETVREYMETLSQLFDLNEREAALSLYWEHIWEP